MGINGRITLNGKINGGNGKADRLRKKAVALCLEACDIGCLEVDRSKQETVAPSLPGKQPVLSQEITGDERERVKEVASVR